MIKVKGNQAVIVMEVGSDKEGRVKKYPPEMDTLVKNFFYKNLHKKNHKLYLTKGAPDLVFGFNCDCVPG